MQRKLIFLLTLISLVLAACSQEVVAPAPTVDPLLADSSPKMVDLTAEDGTLLKATYYPPTNSTNAPAIILVHMLNGKKEDWQTFAKDTQAAGYAVLALDLRGHGESGGSQAYDLMDTDLDAAFTWLSSRPEVDGQRVGLVGASIGANLALRGGARHPEIKSVVLLSPGLDYRGVTTVGALSDYGQRPVMIVAAEGDAYAADSAKSLNTNALGRHQLQMYPGSDHGTRIFAAQAGLKPMILAWFSSTL